MLVEVALAVWTFLGLAWMGVAWRLVAAQSRTERGAGDSHGPPLQAASVAAVHDRRASSPDATLSIFKPLPPLGSAGLFLYGRGLESFVAQLGEGAEMLVGVHAVDADLLEKWRETMVARFPAAMLRIIVRAAPDEVANPKIAWQRVLAPHATGALWLWSDADIIAPEGYLDALREEMTDGIGMVTSPYAVRALPAPPALLDALFVDVEFLPGVLLLRRFGPVDFGLGAGMLFRRDDYLARVDPDRLGAALADDFVLGQMLRAVRIGTRTVETVASAVTWREAIDHYLRWARTVRWNRPGGTLARVITLPMLGWLGAALLHPTHSAIWIGLILLAQAEVVLAWLTLRAAGCLIGARSLLALEAWSLGRGLVWITGWLPGSVRWGRRRWRGLFLSEANELPARSR